MEHLLNHPEKVTPRFLFELYTYNYQRTLFEKVLNDKTDDAIRKVKAGLCGAVKYDDERPNLGIFIELLNIFDDDFLSDKSFVETRREEWFLNPDKPIMNMPWILPETWKAEEQAFREGDRDRDRNQMSEPKEETVELCGKGLVLRELAMWSVLFNNWECLEMIRDHVKDGLEIDDKYSGPEVGNVLGFELAIALILENCLIQGEIYMTNSMSVLKGSFRELQGEIEDYTVKLVDACYSVDSELCSYLIRVENRHWGKRTALALAEKARLKKFMSTHAVQDLLDQIWTGAMEPASNFTLFVCTICPLLVPFFMKPSKNPFIDRIPWLKSGFCWNGQQYPNPVSSRQNVGTNKGYDPGFLMMIANYCTSPLFTMIIEAVFYVGFLALFSFVILQEFCIRVGFYEYILIAWMISIQAERISKFIAIPHMSKRSKIRLILRDPWNILYSFSFVCFVVGLIFRTVGVISYETIYNNNVQAFKDLEVYEDGEKVGIDLFDRGAGNWTNFTIEYEFSTFSAFLSNDANPLYNETTMSKAARDFVNNNYGMFPLKYINAKKDHPGIINYCPLGILTNGIFADASFLKWAQIFYAMTFVAMSMAFLQFYNIHQRLGPLVISIMGMMVDLIMFIFILAMFLVPYGVVTTGLMHPNEHRLAATMEGVFFKPILNLYGDLIMSEYTEYEHNDDLQGCVSAEDIRAIATSNDAYGGFGYVHMTELMKNFTHEWERDLKLWNECTPSHMSQLTAFYLMNYDCDFNEDYASENGKIICKFYKETNTKDDNEKIVKAEIEKEFSLTEIFGECFDRVRVLKVDKDLMNITDKYETTYKYLFDDPDGPFDDFVQKIEGGNNTHYDYYVFSPWEQILPEEDKAKKNTTTLAPTTADVTTNEPTTLSPTTAQDTTNTPTTLAQSTAQDTTNPATTLAPTTAQATTIEPTTVAPTTVQDTTNEPTALPPAIPRNATTDESNDINNGTDGFDLQLETELDKAKNDAVSKITEQLRGNELSSIIQIFPIPSIYTFNKTFVEDGVNKTEKIPENVGIVSERLKLNIFERRITKELDIKFNDVLPDCSAVSCEGSEAIILGALMTYSFENGSFDEINLVA